MFDRVGGRCEDQRSNVQLLTAVLAILVAVAILYEIARRLGVPYPTLLVLGGLGLAFIPGLPRINLEPDLVLLVFLPPLLFAPPWSLLSGTCVRTGRPHPAVDRSGPVHDGHRRPDRACRGPDPDLGRRVHPRRDRRTTDALAATSVFRRLGVPRVIRTLIEGEALFNDATALVAYRAAVLAAVTRDIRPDRGGRGFRGRRSRRDRDRGSSSAGAPARSCADSTTRRSRS